MIAHIIYIAVTFAAGFGVGRIKNAKKLALVSAELAALETDATRIVAEVKAKL